MARPSGKRRRVPAVWLILAGFLLAGTTVARSQVQEREQIGTALGEPVYRDQIRTQGFRVRGELHRLFSAPAMKKYREAHREQTTPTEEELRFATEWFLKSLREQIQGEYGDELRKRLQSVHDELAGQPPEEKRKVLEAQKQGLEQALHPTKEQAAMAAAWTLTNWKFQRLLYEQCGGGRILWQQAGLEAFDAMHQWLQDREAAGDFTISDPELRKTFYEYWTNQDMHGAFLTDDEERIRTTFLEPSWVAK